MPKPDARTISSYKRVELLTAARERNSFYQQLEMDRVLHTAFRMNPYDILDVTPEMDEKGIQKVFRKKSLLMHPDKVQPDDKGKYVLCMSLRPVSYTHLRAHET